MFHERARPGDRKKHTPGRFTEPSVEGRDVQRAECAGHNKPGEFDDVEQSGGSGDDLEPAVRCEWGHSPGSRQAVERRVWASHRLAAGTADTGADTILLLSTLLELAE